MTRFCSRRNKSYSLSNNNGGEEEVPSNPSRDVSADVVQEENGGNAVIQSPADAVGNDKSRIDVVKKSNVIPVPPRRNSV